MFKFQKRAEALRKIKQDHHQSLTYMNFLLDLPRITGSEVEIGILQLSFDVMTFQK